MDKICPYCQSQHLIKNGSAYGVPKWRCKDCLRQTSFKPPRGEPLWKKETAVLLYTLGLSMNAIAKQLGVSTPSILNWIRAHAATHAPRPQPEPGESVVVMELDELWHFLQKNYGGKAGCWKARCSSSARYAAGLRRKRERRTLAWRRCFNRPRVSRHLARSTAARSWALIGARRVSVAARTRTEPRTTRLGEATLRPVVRRSW